MKRDDSEIKGEIIKAFSDSPEIHEDSIRIFVNAGHVRLQGIVDNLEEKLLAGEMASRVVGVQKLQNDITVSGEHHPVDLKLFRNVQDELDKAGLENIGVRMSAGTAFLLGVAPSVAVKERAETVAASVGGVRDVISQIEIAAGVPVDNISLAENVVDAISDDPLIDSIEVHVESVNGSVTIEGEVKNRDQWERATAIASSVPGVQKVENKMSVHLPLSQ